MGVRGRKRCPWFFKIYFPHLSAEQMSIPPKFRHHLEVGGAPATVSLEGPSGETWGVDVVTKSDGLFFGSGWKDFVVDHSLAKGDFILFRYQWGLRFTVLVFDTTACEKESAFLATPSSKKTGAGATATRGQPEMMNGESNGESNFQISPSPVSTTPSDQEYTTIPSARMRASNGKPRGRPKTRTRPSGESLGDKNSQQLQVPDMRPEATITPTHEDKANPQLVSTTPSCTDTTAISGVKTGMRTSNDKPSGRPKTRSRPSGELLDDMNSLQQRAYEVHPDATITPTHEAGVNRIGTQLISQRRPVTHEEVYKTIEEAKKFESSNPFFTVKMSSIAVSYRFYLPIPQHFVNEHLPQCSDLNVTLWDLNERPWVVKYHFLKSRRGSLRNFGWINFCYCNNLEKDDVCVFELIQEYHLRVHIFRVVKDITPLVPKMGYGRYLMDRGGLFSGRSDMHLL